LAIAVTFVSYIGYGIMVGSCVLRDASGNVTEYLMGVNESDPFKYVTNCTGRTCDFGIETDSQVRK